VLHLRSVSFALLACLLASAACRGGPAVAADGRQGEACGWDGVAPLNHARTAHAVVSTGSAIFAFAGTGEGGAPVRQVERWGGERWQVVAQLPGPGLNAPAAAAVGETIYVIGGFETDTNVPSSRVHVFTQEDGTWREAAPLPAPRGGHAAVVHDGKIHVLGGGNSRSTIADHSQYDPATNAWRELAPLPRAEGSPAAVVFNNKIHALGGRSGGSDFGDVYIYDAASDAWAAGPSIEPRGVMGAVVYRGAIHLFGGESQARRENLAEVLRLDPDAQWRRAADMPTARSFARAVVLGDAVYVVGGSPRPEASHAGRGSAVVERYRGPCG
jgi:N-acetylneuraminic acid mutarotase